MLIKHQEYGSNREEKRFYFPWKYYKFIKLPTRKTYPILSTSFHFSLVVQSLPSLYSVSSLLLHSDHLFWELSEAAVDPDLTETTTEMDLITTSKFSNVIPLQIFNLLSEYKATNVESIILLTNHIF